MRNQQAKLATIVLYRAGWIPEFLLQQRHQGQGIPSTNQISLPKHWSLRTKAPLRKLHQKLQDKFTQFKVSNVILYHIDQPRKLYVLAEIRGDLGDCSLVSADSEQDTPSSPGGTENDWYSNARIQTMAPDFCSRITKETISLLHNSLMEIMEEDNDDAQSIKDDQDQNCPSLFGKPDVFPLHLT